jgi:hypothetical protein
MITITIKTNANVLPETSNLPIGTMCVVEQDEHKVNTPMLYRVEEHNQSKEWIYIGEYDGEINSYSDFKYDGE